MKHQPWLCSLAVAATLSAGLAQSQEGQRQNRDRKANASAEAAAQTSFRGKIVRVEGRDQFVLRTSDNKDVTLYSSPRTRYVINGRAGSYADLKAGTDVNVIYLRDGDRYNASAVTVGVDPDAPRVQAEVTQVTPGPRGDAAGTVIRGRVVRVNAPDEVVVRTTNDKEVSLDISPQTRVLIDGRAAQLRDLRVGAEINADYTVRGGRQVITAITVGAAATESPAPSTRPRTEPRNNEVRERDTVLRGRVVRLQGEDRVVVRTSNDREIIVHTNAGTRYLRGGKAVRYSDLRVGADVSIDYNLRDGQYYADSFTLTPAATTAESPEAVQETFVQGTVVRVGNDQVVVKTGDNKEVIIHLGPQTKYVVGEQPSRLQELRTGSDVRIDYDVRDRRPIARIVNGLRRDR